MAKGLAAANGQERLTGAEPHLREVLEALPVALVRLGGDSTFLAVNQQGLAMLGARSLDQLLGSALISLVVEDERANCKSLIAEAISGKSETFEADVTGLTGTRQTIEFRAVAYPATTDGVPSAIVTLRDVTDGRRLAQSLVEAAAAQNEQSQAHAAERSRLLADLEQARHSQTDASEAQVAERERRLQELQEERAALQTAHEGELAGLREAQAEEQRRFADEMAAVTARLEAAAQRLTALDGEKQQTLAEVDALRRAVEEHQSRAAGLAASETSLRTLEARYTSDTDALRNGLNEAIEEHARLEKTVAAAEEKAAHDMARIETLERAIGERDAEHEKRVSELESGHRVQLADMESAHAARLQEIEAASAGVGEAAVQRAEKEFNKERQRLQQAVASAVEAERKVQQALAEERASRKVAERARKELLKAIGQLAQDGSSRYDHPPESGGA
jgi:PAS domain S-box-containing protein